jgi:hypothetical protein
MGASWKIQSGGGDWQTKSGKENQHTYIAEQELPLE